MSEYSKIASKLERVSDNSLTKYFLSSYLGMCLLLGGAGEHYPAIQTALALGALVLAGLALLGPANAIRAEGHARLIALLPFAWLLLIAVQLVPLPPDIWARLPGRDLVVQLDRGIGWQVWRPLSLDPEATFDTLFGLIPALIVWLLTRASSASIRMKVLRVVLGVALVSAGLSLLQISAGADASIYLWETSHRGFGVGFFVNRNHQAAFLLVSIVMAGVRGTLPGEDSFVRRIGSANKLLIGTLALLAGGILATGSRTGLALMPLALATVGYLRLHGRSLIWGTILCGSLAAALVVLGGGAAAQSFARFDLVGHDLRWVYWQNSWPVMLGQWPFGSGFGTFQAMYQQVEPLDQVSPLYVRHAHCDWLEWVLEGGMPAALLLLMGLGLFMWRAVQLARVTRDEKWSATAVAGGVALLLLALCSLTDYPLRMTGLSVLFAFCGAIFLFPNVRKRQDNAVSRSRVVQVFGLLALSSTAVAQVMIGVSAAAMETADDETAAQWAPWRGSAKALQAQQMLNAGAATKAMAMADEALRITPFNAGAVRIAGVAAEATGHVAQAQAMLTVAGSLGWRDPGSQVWLATKAEAAGYRAYEIERVDALLRQHVLQEQAIKFLASTALEPDGAPEVVKRLADRPGWRQGMFNELANLAVPYPEDMLHFADLARRGGIGLNLSEVDLAIWRLAENNKGAAARRLWQIAGGRALIGDGDFAATAGHLPEHASPFHWRSPVSTDVQVFGADSEKGGSHLLRIESTGVRGAEPLAQTLLLAAGSYRLKVVLSDTGQTNPALMDFQINCRNSDGTSGERIVPMVWQRPPHGPQGTGKLIGEGQFDIQPACDTQELTMLLKANDFKPFVFAMQQVSIDSGASLIEPKPKMNDR